MTTARREYNRNPFRWEPVDASQFPFTSLEAMPRFLYEAYDMFDVPKEDTRRKSGDLEDQTASEILAQITPSNAKLRELAARHRPSAEWFEGDEERPF